MFIFLHAADVVELHDKLVQTFGGSHGAQTSIGGHYLHPTIAEMAAAYFFYLVKNHPFIDGNQRTGVASALLFLHVNGYTKKLSEKKLFTLALAVANNQATRSDVATAFEEMLR